MNSSIKTIIFWAVLICFAVLLWTVLHNNHGKPDDALNFTEFLHQVNEGNVKTVEINGTDVKGSFTNKNADFHTLIPSNYPQIYDQLREKNVVIVMKETNGAGWVSWLVNVSPFILLIAFWLFMMRQMQSGGNKALSFGKSRARLHSTQQKKVTFFCCVECSRARLLPKLRALLPPLCIWRIMNSQKAMSRIKGETLTSQETQPAPFDSSILMTTFFSRSWS